MMGVLFADDVSTRLGSDEAGDLGERLDGGGARHAAAETRRVAAIHSRTASGAGRRHADPPARPESRLSALGGRAAGPLAPLRPAVGPVGRRRRHQRGDEAPQLRADVEGLVDRLPAVLRRQSQLHAASRRQP